MPPRAAAVAASASLGPDSPKPSASTPAERPPAPSPLILRLRQDWRWAATSQFCAMFLPTLGGIEWDPEKVESDFDHTETAQIPAVCTSLLSALTLDRKIDLHNHLDYLRKEYERRSPETNKLGTYDEPIPWAEIGLGDKLQVLWDLCEWHMADPERFRGLVNEGGAADVEVGWRINPVGWDGAGNTYYLFDDNRLWVQHPPPPPPPPPPKPKAKSKPKAKVKKAPVKSAPKASKQKAKAATKAPASDPARSSNKRTRQSSSSATAPAAPPAKKARSTRASRGAVEDVWQDIPAEWLQETAEAGPSTSNGHAPSAALKGTGLLSDDDNSDLSDMSDVEDDDGDLTPVEGSDDEPADVEEDEEVDEEEAAEEEAEKEEEAEVEEDDDEEPASELVKVDEFEAARTRVPDYLEWEAVCVCRYDWETFPERFADATNIDEINFYEYLIDVVQPQVTAVFREAEATKKLEEAIRNRKRSSRIQLLESQKEEQERLEAARRATEARLDRVRKEEAQKKLEEDAQRALEQARVDRLREREERHAQREEALRLQREKEEAAQLLEATRREERQKIRNGELPADYVLTGDEPKPEPEPVEQVIEDAKPVTRPEVVLLEPVTSMQSTEPTPYIPKKKSHKKGAGKAAAAAAAAALAQPGAWVLNCEICKTLEYSPLQHGPVACCEKCNEWQHTNCHDQFAIAEQLPKRNWKKDPFICAKCLKKMKPKAPRKPRPPKDKDAPATPAAGSSAKSAGASSKPAGSSKKAKTEAGPSSSASSGLPSAGLAQPVQPLAPPPAGPAPPPLGAPSLQRPYQQQPAGPTGYPQQSLPPAHQLQQQQQQQQPSYYQTSHVQRGYYAPPNAASSVYQAYPNQQPHGLPSPYGGGDPGPQAYYPQPHLQNSYPSYAPSSGHPTQGYPYQQPAVQTQLPMASPYGHAGSHSIHRPSLPSSVSSERGSIPVGLPHYPPQQAPPALPRPPSAQTHMYAAGLGMGQPMASHSSPYVQPPPQPPRRVSGHAPSLGDLMAPTAGAPRSLSPLTPNGPSPVSRLPGQPTNGLPLPPLAPAAQFGSAPPPA